MPSQLWVFCSKPPPASYNPLSTKSSVLWTTNSPRKKPNTSAISLLKIPADPSIHSQASSRVYSTVCQKVQLKINLYNNC
ncbi:unnamed protein product [Dibothriocephalus latus]|uniref:Uncharacterized protein n=1 Tax=Dibothriocephalus latus TaxID=60516 RepID=A0A3P6R8Q2_DIBLA|nr:unnamed protein product [Dibothriocephalus latus]